MNLSELVAQAIMRMLDESGGAADIQRNELAATLGCVPSQINYVITSRFTPERGYTVESRRGGGGYIRITRVSMGGAAAVMHIVNSIGSELDQNTARALVNDLASGGVIPVPTARVIMAACTDGCYRDCAPEQRDRVRAAIFKQMIMNAV
ncbi:MAG: CtsR family transcriptional regulator [Ruminococcaceae bacterium]|nr:CtsR family transcriptional regulator [Oscillospiraceae bacterium]